MDNTPNNTPLNKISLWDASATEQDYNDPLPCSVETDVAIVGGGFTGLSSALHLAERGVDCCVLEATKIGYGGSGRNAGLVNAGMWLPPQDVRDSLGEQYGQQFLDILADAPRYVFSLIDKYQIECEDTRTGTIHAAHSRKGFEGLARRHAEWQRLGAPVDLLDQQQVAEKIGSQKFYGGLLDRRAGTINPMGYVRGLARAATSQGARLHTGVRVTRLEQRRTNHGKHSERKWLLHTDQGTVSANKVVLGTNAYTDDLWPGLKQTFTMIHYLQLATKPLGERAVHILRDRQGVWDTGQIMFSVRRDDAGRLIVGSMGKIIGADKDQGLSKRWAHRQIKRLFPELDEIEFDFSWYGQIAMTPNHLPRVHRLAADLYTPIGYNGRGITTGTVFGKAMADLMSGEGESALPLPVTDTRSVWAAPVTSRLYEMVFKANQMLKSL